VRHVTEQLVRPARPADLPVLPEVERRAGALFRDLGMHAVADDDLPTLAELDVPRAAGRLWVSVDGADLPVGYLLADVVDGTAHVEQVSVDPARGRRGRGRALLAAVADWAGGEGWHTVTLTTFADVPWNAPAYRRLGFTDLPEATLGPQLREVRDREAARGLDAWPRVAMSCPVAVLLPAGAS